MMYYVDFDNNNEYKKPHEINDIVSYRIISDTEFSSISGTGDGSMRHRYTYIKYFGYLDLSFNEYIIDTEYDRTIQKDHVMYDTIYSKLLIKIREDKLKLLL